MVHIQVCLQTGYTVMSNKPISNKARAITSAIDKPETSRIKEPRPHTKKVKFNTKACETNMVFHLQ